MDQNFIQQQYNQAIQAFQNGEGEMAEHLLKPLLIQLPDHPMIGNALATVLVSNGKYGEAIVMAKKCLKKNPKQSDLLGTIAAAYAAEGKSKEAELNFSKAIQFSPKQSNFYFSRGNFYMKQGQEKQAIADFKKCVELDKNFVPAYVHLGVIYHQKNALKEADIYYTEALKIDEKHPLALINMGHCKIDLGLIQEGIEYYEKSLSISDDNEEVYVALGKIYLELNQFEKGSSILEKGIAKHPNSAALYLLAGNLQKEKENFNLAEEYFEKSLQLDPQMLGAEQNLRKLLNGKIPDWHFTMLADEERNNAYQAAIEKVVEEQSTVLDIGTGSALLSMMAARAGAHQIYACEMHADLARAASEIVKQNNFEKQIQVFNKKSTQLDVERDQLQRADVLVSEILDAGVIGEGVLPSIRHALTNLCESHVKIIPAKAKLYAQLIEIPNRSRLNPVKEISGFDLSYFDRYRVPNQYTTVQLQHEKYSALSEEFYLHEYDFYNIPAAIQDNQAALKNIEVPILNSGELQAVVFWFDLYLDDEIKVSSRPGGELLHWGQALFCFSDTQDVNEGDSIQLQMIHSDQMIRFDYQR